MPSWSVLLGFIFIFLIFFLQLPLHGSLPGNIDTLLAISLSNVIREKFHLFFSGSIGYTVLYPTHDIIAYGENCYGLASLFIFFRLITGSDIWGYYLFLSLIFALNSFAVFKLSSLFTRTSDAAILAGIAFSFASFTLANVDDPNVVFVFFPVLALYFLERSLRRRSIFDFDMGVSLSGIQIWFGFYIFLFQFFTLLIFISFNRVRLNDFLDRKKFLWGGLIYFGASSPLLAVYVFNHLRADVKSPYGGHHVFEATSLYWFSFLNVLKGNLIYNPLNNHYANSMDSHWARLRQSCFPGFLLPPLAVLGFWVSRGRTQVLKWIFFVFLIFALGVNIPFLEPVIARLPLGSYLRVPLRGYFFALIPLVIFFAIGAERLSDWLLKKWPSERKGLLTGAILILGGIYVLENAEFPLARFEYRSLLEPPPAYVDFFRNASQRKILLDLPSSKLFLPNMPIRMEDRVWTYNREMIYMNWETFHHQIILNGINGYLPAEHMKLNEVIQQVPESKALNYLKSLGTNYLVFHKNLIIYPNEDILERLKKSPGLELVLEDGDLSIFKLTI